MLTKRDAIINYMDDGIAGPIDKQINDSFSLLLSMRGPSDQIFLTQEDDAALNDVYRSVVGDADILPSDIFFSGNIPLQDCEIVVDETKKEDGIIARARVCIFEEYKEWLKETSDDDYGVIPVGAVEATSGIFFPLWIARGQDALISNGVGVPRGKVYKNNMSRQTANGFIAEFYKTWYAIQIFLLNPETKETVMKSSKKYVHGEERRQAEYQRKAKYIRVHRINVDELKRTIDDGKAERNRKTLAWYVIGHWRHYKNGKAVFVNGYWKGKLRALKRNVDNGRKRII